MDSSTHLTNPFWKKLVMPKTPARVLPGPAFGLIIGSSLARVDDVHARWMEGDECGFKVWVGILGLPLVVNPVPNFARAGRCGEHIGLTKKAGPRLSPG